MTICTVLTVFNNNNTYVLLTKMICLSKAIKLNFILNIPNKLLCCFYFAQNIVHVEYHSCLTITVHKVEEVTLFAIFPTEENPPSNKIFGLL